jgi:hypothetical protein
MNAFGLAHLRYLEGSFPAGGEFVKPFSIQDSTKDPQPGAPYYAQIGLGIRVFFETSVRFFGFKKLRFSRH